MEQGSEMATFHLDYCKKKSEEEDVLLMKSLAIG